MHSLNYLMVVLAVFCLILPVSGAVPSGLFSSDIQTAQVNETITFTDLSTEEPTVWLWDFGDGNTSTAQNPQHTYTTAGAHTVTLTASHPYDSDTETKTSYITVAVVQFFTGRSLKGSE